MARPARAVPAILLVLLATACGGTGARSGEGPYGKGADEVWVFRPAHDPRSVVVFVHGHGGPGEDTPQYHLPWLRHLVSRGNAVLYPRYELHPGAHGTVRHIAAAVRAGVGVLGRPDAAPGRLGQSPGRPVVNDS